MAASRRISVQPAGRSALARKDGRFLDGEIMECEEGWFIGTFYIA
jgi:hypothetical protein